MLMASLFFIGLILLFIALLDPWEQRSRYYYAILIGISGLLFLLLLIVGTDILVKMNLPGHWAEDIAVSIGFICAAGFFAGIIGFLLL